MESGLTNEEIELSIQRMRIAAQRSIDQKDVGRIPVDLPAGVRKFLRSASPWLYPSWRSRLYGTELVRVYIIGDAIHRVWGPDTEWRPSWRVA